jgi:hypothetical protein
MYEVPIQISVDKGLVSNTAIFDGLTQCLNMIVRNGQLTTLSTKTLYQALSTNWPFPQLFKRGHPNQRIFICTASTIYELIYQNGVYIFTLLLDNLTNAGYPWGAASVGEFIIFTNNKTVVYNWDVPGQNKTFIEYTTGNIPIARDICAFGSQFIVASPWMFAQYHPGCIATSRVANADFNPDRTNIAQIIPVDYCGAIYRVLPTDKGFNAYGVEGIAEFTAISNDYTQYSPVSYSQKLISNVGLYSQLAVAAAPDRHCYVGVDLLVREVSSRGVKVLDFGYILKDAPSEIIISYDESLDEFYITY